MMDAVGQVQECIAALLNAQTWFAAHGVEIIQQNKADLAFLLNKQVGALQNVVMVVGCDHMTNQNPALEMTITVTAVENVPLNRARDGWCSAIDAVQAAIYVIDGEWWHFDNMSHDTPAERVLQATATFRGLVKRVYAEGEVASPTENQGE